MSEREYCWNKIHGKESELEQVAALQQQNSNLEHQAADIKKGSGKERYATPEQFCEIVRTAYLAYQRDAAQKEQWMQDLEERVTKLMEPIPLEPRGIPLSRISERLGEFEDMKEVPREYVERAIGHHCPSEECTLSVLKKYGYACTKMILPRKHDESYLISNRKCGQLLKTGIREKRSS